MTGEKVDDECCCCDVWLWEEEEEELLVVDEEGTVVETPEAAILVDRKRDDLTSSSVPQAGSAKAAHSLAGGGISPLTAGNQVAECGLQMVLPAGKSEGAVRRSLGS